MIDFKIVIPARYDSQRLPGKPMLEIKGRPMIAHVYDRALESGAQEVIVATDDHRIFTYCLQHQMKAELTSRCHRSGTDRIAEIAAKKQWPEDNIIVNLQGDEPLVPAVNLSLVAENLAQHAESVMATLCERITTDSELLDPNTVKVVRDRSGQALYFSRAPIPWWRDGSDHQAQLPDFPVTYRHIGLYAYRAGFLRQFSNLAFTDLEMTESLEQLRVLEHGYKIHVGEASVPTPPSVDTTEDLDRIRQIMQ